MGNNKKQRNSSKKSSKKSPEKNTLEFYKQRAAVIPECRDRSEALLEYSGQDEPIWNPPAEVPLWYSLYSGYARFYLCQTQCQKGIAFQEALSNSVSGMADQYVSDCLHQNHYMPLTTLAHIKQHGPPQKLMAKWETKDRELFAAGYAEHGKNFCSLRKQYLPEKTREEIIVYYYKWKWTAEGRELNRQRNLKEKQKLRRRKKTTPERTVERIPEFPASTRHFTRSAAAEQRAAIAAAQGAADAGASTSTNEV